MSAINVQGKKLHTMKTLIDLLYVLEELGGINAVNIMWSKSVNSSVIEKTIIILKIETFARNNRSF